jgi:prepilin-type processing-associated H-X9-DG protein
MFEQILNKLDGPVNYFWLDGHFSGDITFQGESISPIIKELNLIEKYKSKK